MLTMWHLLYAKVGADFADKRQLLGRYHSWTQAAEFSFLVLVIHLDYVWWSGGIAPSFLTWALDGGKWSASCPGHFTHMETGPAIHWIGG
jgi:hypothetical protein